MIPYFVFFVYYFVKLRVPINQRVVNPKLKNMKANEEYLSILFGTLTFILFAAKPYLLDWIEPAKSIGQVIGENARDLMDNLAGEVVEQDANSKRGNWSNGITIIAFILFVITMVCSAVFLNNGSKKILAIAGGLLAIAGLVIYFSYLAIGLIGLAIIGVLVLALVAMQGAL